MLPHTITGTVVEGRQLGRELGFPTANVPLADGVELANGAYAAWVTRADGTRHRSAASIGVRPTVDDGGRRLLEVHILDQESWVDLYGEVVSTTIVQMIRPERRFASLDELRAQIADDCDTARRALTPTTA